MKPDPDKFAYIRCQSCRRRFDGREGPDPEVSDEALARGDPVLLRALRETSAEMTLSIRARTDPQARRARLAELETEVRGLEDELRRIENNKDIATDRDVVRFVRHSLEEARGEIAALRRLDIRTVPPPSGRA